ncbi:NAP-domain-containing protein [Mycena indigotica]|uniref:NAP-domain-containing protein n=1 Tax=Mycena indigotica TaxID=2126181 RepID=A0A8H6SRF2_9AGAR|nr:NAP-domain-containing protein [Mycena indigotica]KAF7303532.1 NAP-domain-containing protein [Mycena indigotica]
MSIRHPVLTSAPQRKLLFPLVLSVHPHLHHNKGTNERKMSANVPINASNITAPTPQNTPLNHAPISQGLSRPTVPDISEEPDAEVAEEISTLGAAGVQSAMLGMVQGKLAGLVGRSSGYVESLPVPVRRNVEGLKGIQIKQTELQNQYKRECLELERKYLELQKPLYARRHEIIIGTSSATTEEIEAGDAAAKAEDSDYESVPAATDDDEAVKGIPDFWLTALRNHPGLAELITERDAEALAYLKDITLSYLPKTGEEGELAGKPGFTITFHWNENPFFTDATLTKTYIYQEEVGYSGDFVYDRAVGSKIAWKEDKDLTREWEIKKQRNKNTNRTRLVRKSHPTASFFNFFSPPVMPSDEDIESGDVDPDDLDEIEDRLEVDYQVGEDLKEKIIPRAVDYFTGKALEYELVDSDDEFDEDDDEDEDEEGDEFDEDSDSDDDAPARRIPPSKRRGGGPAGGSGSANVNPEECKQQ